MIECKCGCGELITEFDSRGRPHLYKNHHGTIGKKYSYKPRPHIWKGGRYINNQGYVMLYVSTEKSKRYRGEHRVMMGMKLGRKLHSSEIVHHIDGDKTNNSPDNLIICSRSEHKKLHPDVGMETRFKARI